MKRPEGGKTKSKRPGSVVVAGWFAILAVPLILLRIGSVLTGGELMTVVQDLGNPSGWLAGQGLNSLLLLFGAPVAVISLVAGIAILSLKRWAWVVLMVFLAAALLLNLIRSYFQAPEYGLMLIYAVLALILNQPDVRQAFRVGRATHDTIE